MDSTKSNVAVAALDWSYKLFRIERGLDALAGQYKFSIRYEDLLVDPELTVRSVTDFLGVDYEESMLDFYRTSRKYVGDHHSKLIFRPLDNSNRTKWRKNLDLKEVRVFELLGRHYLTKYRYDVSAGAVAPEDVLFALKALSTGLPLRLIQVLRVAFMVEKALRTGKPMGSLTVGQVPSDTSGLAGDPGRSPKATEASGTCTQPGFPNG